MLDILPRSLDHVGLYIWTRRLITAHSCALFIDTHFIAVF